MLSKYAASWKLSNYIIGRKLSKRCIIKARNKEASCSLDRLTLWYEYFNKLLGVKYEINYSYQLNTS